MFHYLCEMWPHPLCPHWCWTLHMYTHSTDVSGAGQSVVQDYPQVPHSRWRQLKGIKEHLNTWAAWCVLSIWYFKSGLVLFAPTGVEHCAGVHGVRGSWQQGQLAREFKQTTFCLLHLHFSTLRPILVELTKPANLTFRVATDSVTNQGTTCTLSYLLRFGTYIRLAVFGCEEKANMIIKLNIAPWRQLNDANKVLQNYHYNIWLVLWSIVCGGKCK